MCKKRSSVVGHIRGKPVRLDACIRKEVEELNLGGIVTLGSCCGHGVYPKTIVVKKDDWSYRQPIISELFSGMRIPRTRRFYMTDRKGRYFIPETSRSRS